MKKNILYVAVMTCLISACSGGNKEEQTSSEKTEKRTANADEVALTPQQVKNAGIETGSPEQREMHSTLNVNGVLEVPPENIIAISIPMGGYVKKTNLIAGMPVAKGTLLATIEDQQYIQLQQDYLTGKSRLQFLEADYARQKGLNATKTTSDKLFQQSQNEYNSQQILVKSLAEKLRLIGLQPERLNQNTISRAIPIYSPIAGYVTKINVNTGKYVTPTDVLFELTNPKDLHVSLTVFENDAAQLKPGQKVTFTTNSNPDKQYTAKIHLVTPNIGDQRSTEVHCDLEGPSKALLPGTFINAEVQLNQVKALAVPDDAIVKWEKKDYVFVAEGGGRFKMIAVETAAASDGFTAIKSSLTAATIVTKNAYSLLTKMKNGGEE